MSNLNPDQQAEIDAARAAQAQTRRPTVPALEEILYAALPVLDGGFVRVIDYFGDDAAIVQAARVSYGKGTKKVSDDRNLIRYLMRHRHSTPFEMCEIKLHVKLPIFVARQWIRHRTANVNEYSARYSILDREFYVPVPSQLAAQSTTNRQGRGDLLEGADAERALSAIENLSAEAYRVYEELLNETRDGRTIDPSRPGLARELARMTLPTNYYTQWYWKIDLNNLFHFLSLRADSHAQYEIRVYAEAICGIVERWCPIAYEAFKDYRMTGVAVSGPGLAVIKRLLAGENVTQENSGLGKREWTELMETLGR
ncbi:MAG: FAD-dependent thymidylate synthase [Tagaea sp.]|nr:FAD-dependent thymidylate synthase [Azospirillum sp.]MCA3267639.1 FAD-dependent thymidylate synthase [Azospirillum sp.]MCZ8122838.1 FAD-dependent thymidylate synthase [Magnetospirillum sp.]